MATTEQDLENFARFVAQRVSSGEGDVSLDDLFDLWRLRNPSDSLLTENVAAIAASIEDFKRGERGTELGSHSAELRGELGLAEK